MPSQASYYLQISTQSELENASSKEYMHGAHGFPKDQAQKGSLMPIS